MVPVLVGWELFAIVRDAGVFVHDCFVRLCEVVDEGGFFDVRIADDRDFHALISLVLIMSVVICLIMLLSVSSVVSIGMLLVGVL